MPQLPTYNSQANIQPTDRRAVSTGATQVAESISRLGGAVEDFGVKWMEYDNLMAYTQSKGELSVQLQKEKQAALDDPNKDNVKAHLDKIASLKAAAVSNIKHPRWAAKASAEFEQDIGMMGIEIDEIFKKKKIGYTRAVAIPSVVDGIVRKKMVNPDRESSTWKQADDELKSEVQKWVDGQILNEKEAQEILSNERKLIVMTDFARDPQGTMDKLESKDGKSYPELTVEERLDLITKGRTELRRLEFERRDAYESRKYDLLTGVFDNTLNEETVDQLVKQNKMNPDFGIPEADGIKIKAKLRELITQNVNKIPDAKRYVKAVNIVFTNAVDRVKAYDAILDAFDGERNKDEVEFLAKLVGTKDKVLFEQSNGGMKIIRSFLGIKNPDIEKERRILSSYINRVRMSNDGYRSAQEAIFAAMVDEHPALGVNPEAVDAVYNINTGVTMMPTKNPESKKE